jgi:hypothetical protein
MQNKRKRFLPLVLLFIFLNTLFLTAPAFFQRMGIDQVVLIIANALFFLINFISFLLAQRALGQPNPNVFTRSIMAGTMIKMGIAAAAFLAYILLFRKTVNKPAIYLSILLYFIYLAAEVAIVLKMNKQKNA